MADSMTGNNMEVITKPLIPQPQIIRDEKGRIVKPIPQQTNKNGKAGRPCEYCKNKEVLQKKADAFVEKAIRGVNGKIIIPWIEDLALELNTIDENIVNWANKKNEDGSYEHPELFTAYKKVNMIQKLRLKQRTTGRYNATGSIFLLKANHGLIETEKQIHAGDSNEPLEIRIVKEKR